LELPPPVQVPAALASVKMYQAPVGGEAGGDANVALGGTSVNPEASSFPVAVPLYFCAFAAVIKKSNAKIVFI
jgi:hypothetical protein